MKIKHIYITKEGEPMATPPNGKGLLPFEDKDKAKWHVLQQNRDIVIFGQARDTIVPVELEVEVVDQFRSSGIPTEKWKDMPSPDFDAPWIEYRKVLRIKQ